MNPLDYSLCDQTVTLYRMDQGKLRRRVVTNSYFQPRQTQKRDLYGKSRHKEFLLIIPGQMDLRFGDRVVAGMGPEEVQWETFLPGFTDGVYEVDFVQPCFWEGQLCHTQAGCR